MVVPDISSMFQQEEVRNMESAIYDVLKEMTNEKKASMLTELSVSEIKTVLRLIMISKMRKKKIYEDIAELYMKLMISKERKSRLEILKAIKNANPEPRDNAMGLDKLRQVLS